VSDSEGQHQQSSDLPTTGYESAEEERQSLNKEEEDRNASVPEEEKEEEEPSLDSAIQHKRSERRGGGGKRRSNTTTTTIATAASAWQVTLIDLDKQLNKQGRLMERMADDIKHLRKQFNQVQRDLSKFEKRVQKMKKTTTPFSSKRGKRRG
jgi:predicted RNase H-like nuclease (RuvC/YqgF family)